MSATPKSVSSDCMTPQARLDEGGLHDVLGYQMAQATIITNGCFSKAVGEPLGLGQVELTLLQLINQNAATTPSRLARALAVTLPAITAWISKLEQRGWVTRQRSTTDRRSQHFVVTAQGNALATQAVAALLEAEQRDLAHLSPAERAMLLELLHKVARRRKA